MFAFLINFAIILSLTSCFYDDLLSVFKNSTSIDTSSFESFFHEDNGNTTALVNNAFNSLVDNGGKSLISNEKYQIDLSSKTHLTKNMYDLEINEQNTPSKGEIKVFLHIIIIFHMDN